jgi:hypothetical protein
MSMNALVLGTVKFLRSAEGLGLGSDSCDEQVDGAPPLVTGQGPYYAVMGTDWSNDDDLALDELYGLEVTITVRASVAPKDRLGVAILRDLRTYAERVRAKLHMSEGARIQWNLLIPDTDNKFVEPLKFTGASRHAIRGPDWFGADEGDTNPPTGVSMTLSFGKARRVQVIEEQD